MKYNYVFFGYNDYQKEAIDELSEPHICIKSSWYNKRGVKKLVFHFMLALLSRVRNLKFVSKRWISSCFSSLDPKKPYCFLLYASFWGTYVYGLVDYLRKFNNYSKIILLCTDKIDWYKEKFGEDVLFGIIKKCDLIFSYNYVDIKKYGFEYISPVLPYKKNRKDKIFKSDLTFIGKSKGRKDLLHAIYKNASSRGLICDFTIIGVKKADRIKKSNINYDKYLTYEEVKNKISTTKCILNIPQDGAVGITLRDLEAICEGVFLMTPMKNFLSTTHYFDEKQLLHVDELGNSDFGLIKTCIPKFESEESKNLNWDARIKLINSKLGL